MAHSVSAASLHAARTVLKNYDFVVRPPELLPSGRLDGLEPSEKCIAILIDYATNIFKIAELRPELRYWQRRIFAGTATAPQLAMFLNKILEAFSYIPKDDESKFTVTLEAPPSPVPFKDRQVTHTLSKASREASRFLFYYYTLTAKQKEFQQDETIHRNNVAKLVDVCLETQRMFAALPVIQECQAKLKLGQATLTDIKGYLRKVGIFLEYLPTFENREEERALL